MKDTFKIFFVMMALSFEAQAQTTLLSDGTTPIEKRKVAQCQSVVDKINSIQLMCDTVFNSSSENEIIYRFESIYFDKQGRVRKYFGEHKMNDGAHENGETTAYYDEKGELVYIEYDSSNNCEGREGYFYVNDGRVVDFSCSLYCDCCEGDSVSQETIDLVRPTIDAPFVQTAEWLSRYATILTLLDSFTPQGEDKLRPIPPGRFDKEESDTVYCDNLESIGGIVRDSIDHPKTYLLRISDGKDIIALQKGNKYLTFAIMPEGRYMYNGLTFSRQNIDGTGNDELIVRWQLREGRSGWKDGFTVVESGILIWDLDTYSCLLDFQDAYEYNFWWRDNPGEEVVGEETVCQKYKVEPGQKQLIIRKDKKCPEEAGGLKYIYKLTASGFVLNGVQ